MSYSDPQTVTISTVATVLPRISSGVNSGAFSKDDGTVKLSVSHQYGSRTRRTLRLDFSKIAPNPLVSTQNVGRSMSAYVVIDAPTDGFSNAEIIANIIALADFLKLGTGASATTTRLVGGEN